MAETVGGAAARGLESGFNLGLRIDAQAEEKRARQFQEGRQTEADRRAEEGLRLQHERESRAERREQAQDRRGRQDRAYQYGKERQNELVAAATRARAAGGPIPDDVVEEYGRNAQELARIRQDALNYFSRLQTGEENMENTDSGDLYMHFTAATGRRPEEAPQMRQSIQDVQTGLETGNQGLLLQGINGVMKPQLMKGLGEPSPYGGKIVRKEIIGLDPARDGAGRDHPDKFIPRLRVYVEKDGKTQFYDAPVTKNRSTDPNDPVVAVSIDRALDTLGNLGVLMSAIEHPDIKAKLEEGAKAKGSTAQKYLDELYAATAPQKKTTTRVSTPIPAGGKVRIDTLDSQGNVVKTEYEQGPPRQFAPRGGAGGANTLNARLAAVDDALEAGEIDEEQANEEKRAIRSNIRPGAGGKGPSNAEQNSAIRDAENATATRLGLKYDANAKAYRNIDGTAATPAQLTALSKARDAAAVAVRDAATKGQRVTGETITKTAEEAAKTQQSKFEMGKVYTNSKGQKAKFGGVDAEGKSIWLKP